MPFTVALVHNRLPTVDVLNREFSLHLPHVAKFNILDETIFYEVAQNGLTTRVYQRLVEHFTWAEKMKADVVLNVSTILEPAVPVCRKFVSIPVLRINEPMCEEALAEGTHICVLGSLDRAIDALAGLVAEVAARRNQTLHLTTKCVPQAIEQLDMGDWDMHNRLVVKAAREIAPQCNAVILAQLSLLPLLPALKREIDIPVFGSAEPIVTRLARMARNRVPTPSPYQSDTVIEKQRKTN